MRTNKRICGWHHAGFLTAALMTLAVVATAQAQIRVSYPQFPNPVVGGGWQLMTIANVTINVPYPFDVVYTVGPNGCNVPGMYPLGPLILIPNQLIEIEGTPTVAGSYRCQMRLQLRDLRVLWAGKGDGITQTLYAAATVVVDPPKSPLAITTASPLPDATVNQPYSATFTSSGGTPDYIWTFSGDVPPFFAGINLAGKPTYSVSGTPAQARMSPYLFTVSVQDSTGARASKQFSVAVRTGAQLSITTASSLPDAKAGQVYALHFTASGGTPGYSWQLAPGSTPLPSHLTLSADGFLSGTPSQSSDTPFRFAVQVTDSRGQKAVKEFQLTVRAGAPLNITLLDPVPLANAPSLLSGPYVASTPGILGNTGARAVQGISADGFSQLVVRIASDKPGRQLSVQVLDENGSPALPWKIGGVARPEDVPRGKKPLDAAGQFVMVTSMAMSDGANFAYVVYVSPPDFDRVSPEPGKERSVTLRVTSEAPDGPRYQDQKVRILRPPVLLVHGMNADPSAWDEVETPLGTDFKIFRADYGKIVSVLHTEPFNLMEPADGGVLGVKGSALGFTYNAPVVFDQLLKRLDEFRGGTNPAGIPVAAVQMDVVAHSMGGLVSRMMTYLPGYYRAESLTGGYIHKLVTIGTPHRGTPYATEMADSSNACPRIANNSQRDAFIVTATVQDEHGVHRVPGALQELRGTLSGELACNSTDPNYNPALIQIHQPAAGAFTRPLRTVMIAALMTSQQLKNLDNVVQGQTWITGGFALRTLCPNSPLALKLTSANFHELMGDQSDALVTPVSAHDGLAGPVFGAVHSPYTALIGFGKPHLLEPSSGVPERIKEFLYIPASSDAYVSLPVPQAANCPSKP